MEEQKQTEVRIQGIRVVSCVFDGSGYAQGVRNWIRGLYNFGVPMWIQPVSFERDKPDLGQEGELLQAMCATPRNCDVNFVRLSPEVAVNFLSDTMINICSCAWETTKLDDHWVECCNKFDAIFVESDWLVQVFKNSGVNVPVHCVPNCIDASPYTLKEKPKLEGKYTFYSIQQWTERKNGLGLLKAYFNAFTAQDNVMLVLKTYMTRVEVATDQGEKIRQDIEALKRSLNLPHDYPPVYLVTEKLTTQALEQMHEDCDCYVMLDRGEGFGLPYLDAAAAGNPIIATDFGGTRQFLNEENSYCVPYQLTYVCNMEWSPYYKGDQLWAEPDLIEASKLMRRVFDKREESHHIGLKARATIDADFNPKVITEKLLGAIAEVVVDKRGG